MDKRSYRTHYNYHTGFPCRCPWGHDPEHLGSRTASKADWLRGREDMQEGDGAKFLKWLEVNKWLDPEAIGEGDKLLPWVAREWKKGRLIPHPYAGALVYHKQGEPLTTRKNEVYGPMLDTSDYSVHHTNLPRPQTAEVIKLLDEMKKRKKGLDVMQHKAHELFPKVNDFRDWLKEQNRDKYGEILHQFDNGWSIRRLQNRDEARIEGEDMGHCIGGYGNDIENGHGVFCSLRDHRNHPHATIQLTADHWAHKDDPEKTVDSQTSRSQHPEHQALWKDRTENPRDWIAKVGPSSASQQFYGKEDAPPKQEYEDLVNEWLNPMGVHAYGSDDDAEEDDPEPEPWWNESYTAQGTDDPHDYLNYDKYEWAPDEYDDAQRDAGDWGYEGPYLEDGEHDWSSLVDQLPYGASRPYYVRGRQQQPQPGYDPNFTEAFVNAANENDNNYEFEDALENYIQEYGDSQDHDAKHPEINDPWERYRAIQKDMEAEPEYQFIRHMDDLHGQGGAYTEQVLPPKPVQNPQQKLLFNPQQLDYVNPEKQTLQPWQDFPETAPIPGTIHHPAPGQIGTRPLIEQHFGSVTEDPLYYRWTHSPVDGVTLAHNDQDHPAQVPYHQDLATGNDLTHGYAYRLKGGWRLTNWEHRPLEDPYVVNQVVRALSGKGAAQNGADGSWEPIEHDFSRTHYAQPQP